MNSEQQDAFRILQMSSCGLEETFLSAMHDLVLSEDDAEYATQACHEILRAIGIIKGDG